MAKKRTIAYGLLLAILLLTATAAFSLADTQARYVNTAAWNTVLSTKAQGITSDLLRPEGQRVQLGEISGQLDVQIHLYSDSITILSLEVDTPAPLNISVTSDNLITQAGSTATISITPKAADRSAPVDVEIPVKLMVRGEETLSATLVATLPANVSTEETPGEAESTPQEQDPLSMMAQTLDAFWIRQSFPIRISLPEAGSLVRVGIADENGALQPMPHGTRYSLDDGQTWTMLYGGGNITWTEPQTDPVLWLDLSMTEQKAGSTLQLLLQCQTPSGTGTCQIESVALDWLSDYDPLQPRILTSGQTLTFSLPEQWKNYNLQYTLEFLSEDSDGIIAFRPIPESDSDMIITADSRWLTVASSDTLPLAGAYRLTLTWNCDGDVFAQTRILFYVNHQAAS